jgi:hypothetical protein
MKTKRDEILTAEVVSNESTTSQAISLQHMLGITIELVYTGATLDGEAKLEYSMDNVTYRDLPDSGDTAKHTLAASGGSNLWQIKDAYYPWIRLSVTTNDTNAATCTAKVYAKGV